jgi:hypothetical protein
MFRVLARMSRNVLRFVVHWGIQELSARRSISGMTPRIEGLEAMGRGVHHAVALPTDELLGHRRGTPASVATVGSSLHLPERFGVPAPKEPAMQSWRLKVAYFIDPSGVPWHFAERPEYGVIARNPDCVI